MHAIGEGGPQDYAEARRLFGLAAAQGVAAAQTCLANMHLGGEGGAKDEVEARRLPKTEDGFHRRCLRLY